MITPNSSEHRSEIPEKREDENLIGLHGAVAEAISERQGKQNLVVVYDDERYVFQILPELKLVRPVYPVPERTPEKIIVEGQIQQYAKKLLFGSRD